MTKSATLARAVVALVFAYVGVGSLSAQDATPKFEFEVKDPILMSTLGDFQAAIDRCRPLLGVDEFWRATQCQGQDMVVAVVDSGIDRDHSDFAGGRIIVALDMTSENRQNPHDEFGHGTAVAGIICASGSVTGIAPRAKVISLKILNKDGKGSYANLNRALDWLITNGLNKNITVVNLSIASITTLNSDEFNDGTSEQVIRTKLQTLTRQGIAVVSAAGNERQTSALSFPGVIRECFTVSAFDADGVLAGFSNFLTKGRSGVGTDVCTFGTNIYSSASGSMGSALADLKSRNDGTSFAAPMVSGAVLLLQQYRKSKNLRPYTVDELNDVVVRRADQNHLYPRLSLMESLKTLDAAQVPPRVKGGSFSIKAAGPSNRNLQITDQSKYIASVDFGPALGKAIGLVKDVFTIRGAEHYADMTFDFDEEGKGQNSLLIVGVGFKVNKVDQGNLQFLLELKAEGKIVEFRAAKGYWKYTEGLKGHHDELISKDAKFNAIAGDIASEFVKYLRTLLQRCSIGDDSKFSQFSVVKDNEAILVEEASEEGARARDQGDTKGNVEAPGKEDDLGSAAADFADKKRRYKARRILAKLAGRVLLEWASTQGLLGNGQPLADLQRRLGILERFEKDEAATKDEGIGQDGKKGPSQPTPAEIEEEANAAAEWILATHAAEVANALGDSKLKGTTDQQVGGFFDTRYFHLSLDGVTSSVSTFDEEFSELGSSREYRELKDANRRLFSASLTLHFRRRTLFEVSEEISGYSTLRRAKSFIRGNSWFRRLGSVDTIQPRDPNGTNADFCFDLSWLNFEVDVGFSLPAGTKRAEIATSLVSQNGFFVQTVLTPLAFDWKFYDGSDMPVPTTGLSIGPSFFFWGGSDSEARDFQYALGYGLDSYFVIPAFYRSDDGDLRKTRSAEGRLGVYRVHSQVPQIERLSLQKVGEPAPTERLVARVKKSGNIDYERSAGFLISGFARLPVTAAVSVVFSGNVLIFQDVVRWTLAIGVTFSLSDLAKALGA